MHTTNPLAVIQQAKFNRFHLILAAICFLLIVFDGYDVAIYGTITPTLMEAWGIDAVQAGTIGSAGLFGMLVGAFTCGALADRLGRRRVLLATILLYSVFTALCGFAHDPFLFAASRFVAGLGLGGVMPNVIALLSDFTPRKNVGLTTTIVLSGFAVGGLLAPVLGIFIIPAFGWQWSLWIAALPLILLPWIAKMVPESFSVLEQKGDQATMARQMRLLAPERDLSGLTMSVTERSKSSLPVADLFTEGRGSSTLLFWTAFFFHLMLAYGIMNWLPKIMMENGFDLASSLGFMALWQVGGIIGSLLAGRAADKFGAKNIVIGLYAVSTLVIAGVGLSDNVVLSSALIAVAGGAITGVQNLVQVYIAQYYPPFARATALGSASSIGRLGAMVGPLVGGVLIALAFGTQAIFFCFAVPGILAALCIALVKGRRSHRVTSEAAEDASSAEPLRVRQGTSSGSSQ